MGWTMHFWNVPPPETPPARRCSGDTGTSRDPGSSNRGSGVLPLDKTIRTVTPGSSERDPDSGGFWRHSWCGSQQPWEEVGGAGDTGQAHMAV